MSDEKVYGTPGAQVCTGNPLLNQSSMFVSFRYSAHLRMLFLFRSQVEKIQNKFHLQGFHGGNFIAIFYGPE